MAIHTFLLSENAVSHCIFVKVKIISLIVSLKVALVGPNGKDTLREQLTSMGTKLIYDEKNLIIERDRTW